MNLVLLLCVTIGLFSCQCMCFNVRMTALRPRGFRACLVSEKGIESFSFYAYTSSRKNRRRIEGNATSPVEGLWCYTKKDITLKINDEIVFWYRVDQNGEQHQTESEIKKFQASDFVDESGIYRSTLRTTSVPSPPQKSTTESSHAFLSQDDIFVTTADKVAQQEQIDDEDLKFVLVQPVTPKRGLLNPIIPQQPAKYELSASDLQAASEIFDNPSMVPDNFNNAGYSQTLHTLVPQEHSEAESHHKVIEPHYAASIHIDKTKKNGETDDRLIVSTSEMDVPLQQKDDKIIAKGTDEYDYAVKGDSININIIINREATPCNTSGLFGVPNIDSKSIVPAPEEDVKNKTKSCEVVLSRERKLGEAVRSSYQECVMKVNTVENDLIDSKKEAKVLSALLKETLEMINYLKVNSTNKLILKSSIVLTDYKQILRDIIHVLLDVQPSQYNIVKSELEGDSIIKFEVSAYNEKLLLFLNGRIKLPGSNFQLIDYDAHVQHQKQAQKSKDDRSEE